MKEPLISIIVPAYNAESTIEACIASVAAQTYRNIELIIVNDGSTDATAERIAATADKYPDLNIVSLGTAHIGVSGARNEGLNNAKGELIAFLDADDSYLPDAMEFLLSLMITTDADIAIAQYNACSIDKEVLTATEAVENTLYQKQGFHESPCAKLYRRHIFDGLRFASGRRYEDMELCPDVLMKARKVAVSGRKIYNYTDNPDSFINNWTPARLDALWATASITDKWGERFPGGCRHRRFSACFNIFNLASMHGDKRVADECWTEIRRLRSSVLRDARSRRRNRLAAAASYIGKKPMQMLIRTLLRQY